MKRDYATGNFEDVRYFTGIEVEKTPAHGKKTLFVTGLNSPSDIRQHLADNKHIFFGANHSFDPASQDHSVDYYQEWEKMIQPFLSSGMIVSLDIPLDAVENFLELSLVKYDNFIPQIRIPIPHIKSWNYNTMLKIDDKGFDTSNPGVWCHSLHDLMDRFRFTNWNEYKNDQPINTEETADA